MSERSDGGASYGQVLNAVVDGRREGSSVRFLKMYDGSSEDHDVVQYEGSLDADGNEIQGRWTVPGIWSGTFIMVRNAEAKQAETREVEEKLPLGR